MLVNGWIIVMAASEIQVLKVQASATCSRQFLNIIF
jgi:hypothetical protein